MSDDAITLAEAAAVLHKSVRQVRRYLSSGARGVRLASFTIGQQRFIDPAELDRFARSLTGDGPHGRRPAIVPRALRRRARARTKSALRGLGMLV